MLCSGRGCLGQLQAGERAGREKKKENRAEEGKGKEGFGVFLPCCLSALMGWGWLGCAHPGAPKATGISGLGLWVLKPLGTSHTPQRRLLGDAAVRPRVVGLRG